MVDESPYGDDWDYGDINDPNHGDHFKAFYLMPIDDALTERGFHQALANAIRHAHLAAEHELEELAILSARPMEEKQAGKPKNWRLRDRIWANYFMLSGMIKRASPERAIKEIHKDINSKGYPISEDGAKTLYYSVKKKGPSWVKK